jgi:hypothetical protein
VRGACKRERGEEKPRTSGGSEAGQLSPGPHGRRNDQSWPEQAWAILDRALVSCPLELSPVAAPSPVERLPPLAMLPADRCRVETERIFRPGAHKGHAFFAYANNYLIDTDHGVIVDVEATRAIRQAEAGAARTMLERTETRFGIKPAFLAADSAYGSAESLAWLVKRKEIAPHIPVFDKSNRTDGTFSRADFVFDAERDRYTCPAGKELVQFRRTYAIPRSGVTAEGTRLYRASKLDCDVCKLKAQCCPNALARKIPRDLDEDARDVARAHAATQQYVEACRRRKKVEMLFAHLKRILRLTRLRLRGPNGAKDEFLLAATAQNLRRLARLRPINVLPEMLPV